MKMVKELTGLTIEFNSMGTKGAKLFFREPDGALIHAQELYFGGEASFDNNDTADTTDDVHTTWDAHVASLNINKNYDLQLYGGIQLVEQAGHPHFSIVTTSVLDWDIKGVADTFSGTLFEWD